MGLSHEAQELAWPNSGSEWVQQFTCHGFENQQWRLVNVAESTYERGVTQIRSLAAGDRCLKIASDGTLRTGPCSPDGYNTFKLYAHPRPNEQQHLVQVTSGWCMDVPWESRAAGVAIQRFPCKAFNDGNQAWTLTATADGRTYQVRNVNSGLCLAQDTDTYTGLIRQQPCNATNNYQRFRFRVMTDGTLQMIPRYSWSEKSCVMPANGNKNWLRAESGCVSGASQGYWFIE
jgi:hypothetical protein